MDMFIGDSDWECFSESDSSEDQEEIYSLYNGQAWSILSSLEESIGKIDDFLSFERGFIHGDMVCSVTDPSGQMGRVLSIDMVVDLENVHGKITKNVNSKMLLRIRSITVGDYVAHGPWLGKVAKVVDTITIMFDDGSNCEVTVMDPEKVLPVSPNLLEDPQYPFYPGQRVQVRHLTASKSARWFCGAWKENKDEGTVCCVKASLVYVDWLASALVGCKKSLPPLPAPPCLQESKNLTLLSCFSHANWQLGDWCILPISSCKDVMEKMLGNSSTREIIEEYMKVERGFKRGLNSNFEEIFVIVKTKTKVDVVWQDGSQSLGLDSQSLIPANVVNAHEFWPQQFVLEKGTCDDPLISSSQKWGVVMGVDAKERTVKVKWKTSAPKQRNDLGGDWMEETVSAYELVEHPDYSYCYSDVVFRMVQDQNADQEDKDHVNSDIGLCVEAAVVDENCGRDKNEYPDKYYLSYIGNVTGFEDGAIEVRWADGLTTKVAPYEIFRIDKYDVLAPTPVLSDGNVEELNQEIIEHGKQSSSLKGKDLLNAICVDEDWKKHQWESTSSFFPRSAIGYFMSIAASLLGYFGSTSLSGSMLSGHNYEDGNKSKTAQENELENCNLLKEKEPMGEGECPIRETTGLKQPIEWIQENIDIPFSSDSNSSEQFRRFNMVGDCSDHHFLDRAGKESALSQVKQYWLKKVQQEWNILENNLPETIYVRVYEERMDLMRAAIIGAPGTPYHDGLFFFDIFLPPEYPHEPPLVHYHSGGLRVNPNLYESGKVCLSLLNTWTGTGTEVWNHGSSTILQVLLSLQALVLNDKPYFNEAGYDKQIGRAEGEKNSVSYNENAFIVTCKSMLYTLRRPPKHFEAFVEEHFSGRSQYILSACKAYMEGAPIGCDFGKDQTEHENQKESSTGFKIMLEKLFPKFLEAFSDKGFDCSQFVATEK